LREKALYFLEHEDEREAIARRGLKGADTPDHQRSNRALIEHVSPSLEQPVLASWALECPRKALREPCTLGTKPTLVCCPTAFPPELWFRRRGSAMALRARLENAILFASNVLVGRKYRIDQVIIGAGARTCCIPCAAIRLRAGALFR